MWGWGRGTSGYCGSASLQTVALYYGNWLDQDAVRGATGGHDGAHQLLLTDGGCCSSVDVARQLHLNVSVWPHATAPRPQAAAFVKWMARSIDEGHPVVFGVYMATERGAQYDHIVPLVGYEAEAGDTHAGDTHAGDTHADDTHAGDQVHANIRALLYNDLHSDRTLVGNLSTWVAERAACEASLPWAERFSYCLPADTAFGYRTHGNHDPRRELVPARLRMHSWAQPDTSDEDGKHEPPQRLTADVEIRSLAPGESYALLQYDDVKRVPPHSFLSAGGWLVRTDFVSNGTTHRVHGVSFWSNSTQFFRCVRADSRGE